jgi:hypothetical protein
MKFGSKIGKVPVLVGNCPGFVGNRMLGLYTSAAVSLLMEGTSSCFQPFCRSPSFPFEIHTPSAVRCFVAPLKIPWFDRPISGFPDP